MSVNMITGLGYMPSAGANPAALAGTINTEAKELDDLANAVYAAKDEGDAELLESCRAFESYFLQIMFREMRKTSLESEDGAFAKSSAELVFRDMLDEQMSIQASNQGGIGLAAFMYKQMKLDGQTEANE